MTGEMEKLVKGGDSREGKRGTGGGELYKTGEREKLDWGRGGRGGKRGRFLSYMS